MSRNRVTDRALQQQAARRDYRRTDRPNGDERAFVDPGPSPSDEVSVKELRKTFQSRLSAEERHLADQRSRGVPWAEIAAEVGGTPDALQLERAIDRVTCELRLQD